MNLNMFGVICFVIMGTLLIVHLVEVIRRRYSKKAKVEVPSRRVNEQDADLDVEIPVTGVAEIQDILNDISFAPSCVDMGWKWEVYTVGIGYLIRTSFQRPERKTGQLANGFGRWWFVPFDVTLSGVVKTSYKAALLILEHELMESFKYKGKRIFNPHNKVSKLASIDESAQE